MESSVEMTRDEAHTAGSKKTLKRFEEVNRGLFKAFKILGIFLIRWDDSTGTYVVLNLRFFLFYSFWFIWPLIGFSLAVLGKEMFGADTGKDDINNVMESALFILAFAVVPAFSTFSLKLVTRHLLNILTDIRNIQEFDIGYTAPIAVHLPSRPVKPDAPLPGTKTTRRKISNPQFIVKITPVLTVMLSVVSFITAWVFGLMKVVKWNDFVLEWPYYVMQFFYITLPSITTWFLVIFVEWQRVSYEKMRVEIENRFQVFKNTQEGMAESEQSPTVSQEGIIALGDYVDSLQHIFRSLNNGFFSYVLGVNFMVSLVMGVFCTSKMLEGFHQILYVIPLAIAIFHLGLVCTKSHALMDQHAHILFLLQQVLRMERRRPHALPYRELRVLRENLLDSPPQVKIIGDTDVGNGLFLGSLGFIISYAVLSQDVLGLQEKNNITVICNDSFAVT